MPTGRRTPSTLTVDCSTEFVIHIAFSSAPSPNVACERRLDCFQSVCFSPFFGRHTAPPTSDTPISGPAWTQQMRPPVCNFYRLLHRFRAGAPVCGPPLTWLDMVQHLYTSFFFLGWQVPLHFVNTFHITTYHHGYLGKDITQTWSQSCFPFIWLVHINPQPMHIHNSHLFRAKLIRCWFQDMR